MLSPSADQPENSVLFAGAVAANQVKSIGDELIPLAELIVAPKLSLWQQCYLYVLDAAQGVSDQEALQRAATLMVQLPQSALILTASGWVMGHFGAIALI